MEGHTHLQRNAQGAIVVTDPALEKAIRLKAEKKKRQSVQDDLLRRVERIEKVLGLDAG